MGEKIIIKWYNIKNNNTVKIKNSIKILKVFVFIIKMEENKLDILFKKVKIMLCAGIVFKLLNLKMNFTRKLKKIKEKIS